MSVNANTQELRTIAVASAKRDRWIPHSLTACAVWAIFALFACTGCASNAAVKSGNETVGAQTPSDQPGIRADPSDDGAVEHGDPVLDAIKQSRPAPMPPMPAPGPSRTAPESTIPTPSHDTSPEAYPATRDARDETDPTQF